MNSLDLIRENSRSKGFLNLLIPYYEGLSIVNILPTILNSLGYKCNLKELDYRFINKEYFEDLEKVLLIIIDSLNYEYMLKVAGLLKINEYDTSIIPITSVAPTTTATALTSIYTGTTPQEHGVLGYRLYMRELGMVVKTIEFAPIVGGFNDSLKKCGVDISILVKAEPLPKIFSEKGLKTCVIGHKRLEDTAFTNAIVDECETKTYLSLSDMLANCKRALREEFQLIIAYWGLLDSIGHEYGPKSHEFTLELKHIILSIRELLLKELNSKSEKCLAIITSDHGQVEVEEEKTVVLDSNSDLLKSLIVPPYGESRFLYLKVEDEDMLTKVYTEKFSDKSMLFRTRDLIEKGVFGIGEIVDSILPRLGDFVMVMKKGYCAIYSYSSEENIKFLKGRHGGLTFEEVVIPLVLIKYRK